MNRPISGKLISVCFLAKNIATARASAIVRAFRDVWRSAGESPKNAATALSMSPSRITGLVRVMCSAKACFARAIVIG